MDAADAPDAAVDAPVDAPPDIPGADAGPEAPLPDAGAGSSSDVAPDNAQEVPLDTVVASCPGDNCPLAIAPTHVQLWLRGDDEIDCPFNGVVARVREWPDRSGKANHARPASGEVGPLCGPSAGMLNGKRVITFPRTAGEEDGEHLQVNLAAIQDRPFTVAIVEKRTDAMDPSSWMLGTAVEDPFDECIPHMPGVNARRVLQVGYAAAWEKRASTWGHACGVILDETLATDAGPPDLTAPTFTTLWIVTLSPDHKLGLYLNGRKSGEGDGEGLGPIGTKPPVTGFIGRGYQPLQADSRFKGDIAEVLIFDVALDDEQRRTLERHLQPRWGFAIAN